MKNKLILTTVFLSFLFYNFVLAQDPEGQPDYMYIVCGVNGYPGSGTAEVCFQLRFHSDNTGSNEIIAMAAPLIITGKNLVSVDTTLFKAFANSTVNDWDRKDVLKFDNQDPTVAPFHMLYAALSFGNGITGDGLLANICLTVNDTGTICIDTMAIETVNRPEFGTLLVLYFAGWSGPFCCQVLLCEAKAGDANSDGMLNLSDIIYNAYYILKGGRAPSRLCQGDCNANGKINFSDVIYLVNRLFKKGPPPIKSGLCCL